MLWMTYWTTKMNKTLQGIDELLAKAREEAASGIDKLADGEIDTRRFFDEEGRFVQIDEEGNLISPPDTIVVNLNDENLRNTLAKLMFFSPPDFAEALRQRIDTLNAS